MGDQGGALGQLTRPVASQIQQHSAAHGSFKPKELVTVVAGANDIFAQLQGAAAAGPAAAVAGAGQAAKELAEMIESGIVAKGAHRVLVMNMPGLSLTPLGLKAEKASAGAGAGPLLAAMTQTFNATLAAELASVGQVLDGRYVFGEPETGRPPRRLRVLRIRPPPRATQRKRPLERSPAPQRHSSKATPRTFNGPAPYTRPLMRAPSWRAWYVRR